VNVAEIQRAIGEELTKHEYCLFKQHKFVVSSGKIVLKHKDEIKTGDNIIESLSQDHIRHGMNSKKWNLLIKATIATLQKEINSQRKTKNSNNELLFSIFC